MRGWMLVGGLFVVSCGGAAVEGANPGECGDLIDNDADGFFDCNDSDCINAVECGGTGTTDTQVTGTGDACMELLAAPSTPIESFTVDIVQEWDWDDATQGAYCNDLTTLFCDCTMHFIGSGTRRVAGDGNKMVFEGTFELGPQTDCEDQPNSIQYGSMWFSEKGPAFHTLVLSADGSTVTDWIAHEFQPDCEPVSTDIAANGQNYIIEISEPIESGGASHNAVDTINKLLLELEVRTNAAWSFN